MEYYPVDWRSHDVESPHSGDWFRIISCGKTYDGKSICVQIRFTPYFFVEIPESWSIPRAKLFSTETAMRYDAIRSSCSVVKRKSAWGFDNGKLRTMVQMVFKTHAGMKKAKYGLKNQYQIYESNVDPIIRLFHVRELSPSGSVVVRNFTVIDECDKISTCDIELFVDFVSVFPGESTVAPKLVISSFDIETYSSARKFPLPENEGDYVIQVATTFQRYGESEPYRRVVVCLKETGKVNGVDVISCPTEADVMNTWIDIVNNEKSDILIGYNTIQYDWRYLYKRAMMCVDDKTGRPLVRLSKLGRLLDGGGVVVERELSSNAFGQNKFFMLDTPGVMQLDLLQWVRRSRQLESYSLNSVSLLYLADTKEDLPAFKIFENFEGGSAERSVIASYAVKDTELPLRLLRKLAIFEDVTEMANAVKVPVEYINFRGQQIRCYSCLVRKSRELGYVIPDDKAWAVEGKYEGATVLEPRRGAYFEPIAALDFSSLYPSIMRAQNMSPETLVMDKMYDNIPGVDYYEISTGLGTFRYAQKHHDGIGRGIIPALLDDLAKYRKTAKRDMAMAKKENDDFKEALYDARQKSYKIVMNSCYGFIGASKGFLPCVPIAASVTATGRNMIELTAKKVVELLPGSEVVYGDTGKRVLRSPCLFPTIVLNDYKIA